MKIIFFLFFFLSIEAKVLIMTHCYNKPHFIYWQHDTLKKFLKDDYEFVVFNDAEETEIYLQTEKICDYLKIRSVRVPQEIHEGRNNPSTACADTIQYMIQHYGIHHPDIVVLLDSDMFLIRDFSIREYLGLNDIAANLQSRIGQNGPVLYWLPNLIIFNMPQMPNPQHLNFDLGEIDGVATDTGGYNHYYIQNNPQIAWKMTDVEYSINEVDDLNESILDHFKSHPKLWELLTNNLYDFEFYNHFAFLHFRAGSNWNQLEAKKYNEKYKKIKKTIIELLQ